MNIAREFEFQRVRCDSSFTTQKELNQHRRNAHPEFSVNMQILQKIILKAPMAAQSMKRIMEGMTMYVSTVKRRFSSQVLQLTIERCTPIRKCTDA